MWIERNVQRFMVFDGDSIVAALNKISENKSGFVVVVSGSGHVVGMMTDGDIRRWLMTGASIDLAAECGRVANPGCLTVSVDTPHAEIGALFSDRVRSIPLVDGQGRLVAVALPRNLELSINGRPVGKGHPAYIIAEIGNNHNGDVALAKELVRLAHDAGADSAKFQLRDMSSLYGGGKSDDASQDLGAQYTLDLLARFNLEPEALFEVFDYAKDLGVEPLCTPWDLPSLEALERYGLAGYKVASADLTNHEFLRQLAATGKPLILSTGMSDEAEIRQSAELLASEGAPFCMLHCNSTYPTPYKDVNMRYMSRLAEVAQCPVGYSGHERGWWVPISAVAQGAVLVEKHFTVDRDMEGNDHKVSLLPGEFAQMVSAIRNVEEAMGVSGERVMTQGEMMNREVLAKSLVAVEDIAAGTVVTSAMVMTQSPGQGLQPNQIDSLVGRTIRRDVKARTPFFPSDLADEVIGPRTFRFARPWGLPVRWHDYKDMLAKTNMTLLEYHLSYKDMDVTLADWFPEPLAIDFVVHAPELFAGDHVLDLASPDEAYRSHSIAELQRVIDLTRDLRQYHKGSVTPPLIIVNMGGFSKAAPLPLDKRRELYARMEDSLSRLDREGAELIPQTMPPFPWHFGGQSYHNLFIDADEIVQFCDRNAMRICFDISHSQLACNHNGWSMKGFCEKVGPYSAHLHVVDAKDVDGEGLQIGEGMVDFDMIAQVLDEKCPKASFIPEIWQGHKDGGAGFWFALDKLEESFGRNAASGPAVGTDIRLAART
ncbi:N-acetylneuraminate synthase [Novosphingobium sp. CF614]|uniref:N-acetylneuraminate synthase family protein n=1 Tax=Novosphingobium sp. CF614 TaxID=1884364 RepID=UPI0008EFA424|nr:N-acetylneuraminate synthase family protein [Novosphingobium sp. CF614]SFG19827.1 N-acetylneuraminate synthase [Novosphingobium sp. CF614]